jgi:molecular chaperone DnaK (HSP70)
VSGRAFYDDTESAAPSRYVVGVDLGTTNSAVGFVDTDELPWHIRTLNIPQLVAPFQVEGLETLPSFHYQATQAEAAAGALRLPWNAECPSHAVGTFAREEGIGKPGRLIASAKSWLSHSGVDRTADLLPWQGDTDVERLSPVEASSRYLQHVRDAWDHLFPGYPLSEQDLVITLPASFDEVARELTIESARRAGLPRLVLIEEPQAAFYAWVNRHDDDWQKHISPGQKILVCDIGGGTTDFTLIRASASETSGDVQFHRVAVGEHLILGGDNLDLALARYVERKLVGENKLPAQQWDVLVRTARRVKETLLSENPTESVTINLPAAGAKVIGGGLQVAVTRDEVVQLLVEGFLPPVAFNEQPERRQSGFQDFGLPYAADPGITRYLAAFLSTHRFTGEDAPQTDWTAQRKADPARPDVVLFNGGFFASPILRGRLLEVLASWFAADGEPWSPLVLDNPRLDLAVAHGAAYYGMVRRGEGVGIAATLARSYYIGVGGDRPRAVCLAPGSATAGQNFEVRDATFQLTLAEPVEFPLYVSSTRLVDPPGAVIDVDLGELTPLPPIRTVLHTGRKRKPEIAEVRLHAHLSEVGVLELSCREVDGLRSWRLQFDIRSTTQTDVTAHQSEAEGEGFIDEAVVSASREYIERVFGPEGREKPATLMKGLVQQLNMPKHQWPTSLLRRMWELMMEVEAGRRRSAAHEARWLNLVGYALRPGYGFAVDDWRVAETWRAVYGKVAFAASGPEALVLWRRIAGGLSGGQQLQLAEPLLAAVRALRKRYQGEHASGSSATSDVVQSAELWRLLGALELLPVPLKIELGDAIVDLLPKRKLEKQRLTLLWTLGRLGQRVPLHGPLNMLVPATHAGRWLGDVLKLDQAEPVAHLAAMQLARRTDDRHRDLPPALCARAAEWLEGGAAAPHLVELVRTGGTLDYEEQNAVFGESLPSGLRVA